METSSANKAHLASRSAVQSQSRLVPTSATPGGLNPRQPESNFIEEGDEPIDYGFRENAEVQRTFGRPGIQSQGPAGSRLAEGGTQQPVRFEEYDTSFDYMDDLGEAPPDSAGPLPLMDTAMDEGGGEEADEAVVRARREGKSAAAFFDAMEAAEALYAQQELRGADGGKGEGAEARFLHKLQQQGQAGSPGSPSFMAASSYEKLTPASPRGHQGGVTEATRQRVADRIAESLRDNAAYASKARGDKGAVAAGRQCEEALFNSSHSKGVYLSLASNAIRAAKTVDDVAELVRVASGKPKDETGKDDMSPYTTGLQGYVLKPEY